MAISVVKPEIAISQRTLETKRAASGSGVSLVGSLMAGHIETVAVAATSGDRLDRVLAAQVALSRTRLKALILDGQVAIGERTIRDPGHRVNAGDVIRLHLPPAEAAAPQGEAIPLDIVYEDGDV